MYTHATAKLDITFLYPLFSMTNSNIRYTKVALFTGSHTKEDLHITLSASPFLYHKRSHILRNNVTFLTRPVNK